MPKPADKAYPIPENYLPGGYRCIKVYIPDEDMYQQAFMAAYEFMGTWLAWPRDQTNKAKAIATLWRFGIERVREELSQGNNCMPNITNMRNNPADVCQLQAMFDNNGIWVTVADFSDCGGGTNIGGSSGVRDIRIENNIIVATDQCGDTVPLGPPSPETSGGTVKPAYPEFPADGACLSATNAAEVLEDRLHSWADIRITIIGIVQYMIQIAQLLAAWLQAAQWSIVLWEIFDEIAEWTEDNWNDLEVYGIANDLIPVLSKYYQDDGTMTASDHALLVEEMKSHYSGPPTTTNEDRAWFIVTFIVKNLGHVGMARLSNAAGITEADCDLSGWREVFEFAINRQGWQGEDGSPYKPNVGWVEHENLTLPPAVYVAAGTRRVIDASTITKFKAIFDAELGSTSGEDRTARLFFGDDQTEPPIEEIVDPEGTDLIIQWVGSQADVELLECVVNVGIAASGGHPGGSCLIKRIEVEGTGQNPFA